jgi:hypothetical protein
VDDAFRECAEMRVLGENGQALIPPDLLRLHQSAFPRRRECCHLTKQPHVIRWQKSGRAYTAWPKDFPLQIYTIMDTIKGNLE